MTQPEREQQRQNNKSSPDAVLKKILPVTSIVPPRVYAPSDDSFLMIEALPPLQLRHKRVLDMGTGSGILGLYCALRGADVTASDIDDYAIKETGRAAEMLGARLKLLYLIYSLTYRASLILSCSTRPIYLAEIARTEP